MSGSGLSRSSTRTRRPFVFWKRRRTSERLQTKLESSASSCLMFLHSRLNTMTGVKKFICGRSASTTALSGKRPAEYKLRRMIVFGSHPTEPMIHQRGLPDTGPGNDCNDVDILVCPCAIQESDILLSTQNITSCGLA
jgi:hypothetical protein